MWRTLIFAAGASAPLLVGAAVGARWRPPKLLLALLLSFAVGSLISAVAFELLEKSYTDGGLVRASLGFAAGTVTFVAVDLLIERGTRTGSAVGLGLLAGVTLDGVPENVALGVSLTDGGSIALLVAIFASNFPEALSGAAQMREDGRSRRFVITLWATATLLLAAAVVVGGEVFAGASPESLSVALAFAGGAVLASVIDTAAPDAFRQGGPYVALSSAAGFFTAFLLSH